MACGGEYLLNTLTWEYMGVRVVHGSTRGYVWYIGEQGDTWEHIGVRGSTWGYMGIHGSIWGHVRYMGVFKKAT